jgi:uncharacterized protein (TIGR02588 family)
MKRQVLEWAVLAISIVAIVGLAAVLVVEGLDESQPPDPQVVLHGDQARESDLGWILPATVTNNGDQAAEAVVIEATGTVEGEEESSEIEIPFLPAGSSIEMAFAFGGPPEGDITTRLVSYRIP